MKSDRHCNLKVTEADHANVMHVQPVRSLKGLESVVKRKNFVLVLRYFRPAALPRSEVSNFTRMRQS